MPNPAQLEQLESFIGRTGIYFEVIMDDKTINAGTKVMYLQRAISQDCSTFLQSLDQLYQPLIGDAKTTNIELVRAFKLMNDLCFNHEVKYEGYPSRYALKHYFGSFGVIDAFAFQVKIKEIIGEHIKILSISEGAPAQQQERLVAEEKIVKHTEWRNVLDLPLAQLDRQIGFFLPPAVPQARVLEILQGFLTEEQYLSLPYQKRSLIARHPNTIRTLMQHGLTLALMEQLTFLVFSQLLDRLPSLAILLTEAEISLVRFLSFARVFRDEMLNNARDIVVLVNAGVNLEHLAGLTLGVRREMMESSHAVQTIITETKISFSQLLSLPSLVRADFLKWSSGLVTLVEDAQIPLRLIRSLSSSMRKQFLQHAYGVGKLIDAGFTFSELKELDYPERLELFQEGANVKTLIKKVGISISNFMSFSNATRHELCYHANAILSLIRKIDTSVDELLLFNAKVRELFLNYHEGVVYFVEERELPYEKLLNFSIGDLEQVLKEPDSSETQEIINDMIGHKKRKVMR